MSYFRNFPLYPYKFGNEIQANLIQNLSVYVNLVEELTSDDMNLYEIQYIRDGERPDQMSQRIYDTPDYYWTFFFANEKLRISGWPLDESEVFDVAKKHYPNVVLTTEAAMSEKFNAGNIVIQEPTQSSDVFSGPISIGKILEKNLDMGQLVIEPYNEVNGFTITNAGKGYVKAPLVTLSGGGGTGAIAVAAVTNGLITSIIVSDGGIGYTSRPTVTIAPPDVINWASFGQYVANYQLSKLPKTIRGMAQYLLEYIAGVGSDANRTTFWEEEVSSGRKRGDLNGNGSITLNDVIILLQIAVGISVPASSSNHYNNYIAPQLGGGVGSLTGVYYDFLRQIVNSYEMADINMDGTVSKADVDIISKYNINKADPTISEVIRARLEVIQNTIVQNASTYPLWNPGGGIEQATATSGITNTSFKIDQTIYSSNTSSEYRNWDVSDVKTLPVETAQKQYDAIHHYEDANGDYLDLEIANDDGGVLIPTVFSSAITNLNRLKTLNDDLKQIKVLKPSAISKLNTEFQKLLKNG